MRNLVPIKLLSFNKKKNVVTTFKEKTKKKIKISKNSLKEL